jgi:hypothetical protein
MAVRRHYIDYCTIFRDTVIVNLWCEKFPLGRGDVKIEHRGRRIATLVEETYRQDIRDILGGDSGS